MNVNSKICNLINDNPNTWRDIINDLKINVKEDGELAIFNYEILADFSNPIVQEARGIIINTSTLEVVCWPFRKFGNYNESYADKIDWNNAVVLEKVDGSIIKLWFNKLLDNWQFSTNGTIRAENANVSGFDNLYYSQVIRNAENISSIHFDSLNKDYTYVFELVSPQTQVVVCYEKTLLYHLGTRNNLTGEELNENIGIIKPQSYQLNSLEKCIEAVIELNKNMTAVKKEGFVVVDKNWNRVKIKSPDYVLLHHMSNKRLLSKEVALNVLINAPEKLDSILANFPTYLAVIKFYDYKLEELKFRANRLAEFAKNLYDELSYDRKALANTIIKHPLNWVAFRAIDRNLTGKQIIEQTPLNKILKFIPDYEMEDFSWLIPKDE